MSDVLPRNRVLRREAPPAPAPPKGPSALSVLLRPSKLGPVDAVLAAVVIALIGFGVVMVYSSSAIEGTTRYHDPQFFLRKQGVYAVLALLAMWLTSRIDYAKIKVLTYPALVAVAGMLAACVAGFGHRAGNADRWLVMGPIRIQPSELAKLAIVIWLAYSLSKKAERIKSFSVGFLPHLMVVSVFMALCLKQPDFGSAVVLLFLTFTLMFVAGARVPYIVAFTGMLGLGAVVAIRFSDYRYARYLAWIDLEGQKSDLAYQPYQAVMSFGSGGFSGLGLGRGLQTLYLPEAHTDFISAIIGEELGFIGILGLAAVFLLLVSRGVKIALQAHDDYGSFLAFGISAMFGVQALTNLAVAMSILPTKGLTLPFISYGGSSLIVSAMAAGILLSVSRQRLPMPEKKPKASDAPSATSSFLAHQETADGGGAA